MTFPLAMQFRTRSRESPAQADSGVVADVWRSLSPRMDAAPMASYEILMPQTIIRYGVFAAFGASKAALLMPPHSGGRHV
jgi:hypothetical protein